MISKIKTPMVGIFWCIPDQGREVLVADHVSLVDAEVYGDCLTYPNGHYDVWEEWKKLGASNLIRRGLPAAIAAHEYEELPRGRVIYQLDRKHFVIYADRRLIKPEFIDLIVSRFGLAQETCSVASDGHYRT